MAKRTTKVTPSDIATIHDRKLHRGDGGELHQYAEDGQPVLTTAHGGPVDDNHNTLRVGARGPAVVADFRRLFRRYSATNEHLEGQARCSSLRCHFE